MKMKQHFHEQLLWTGVSDIRGREEKDFFERVKVAEFVPLAEARLRHSLVNGEPGGGAEVLLCRGQRSTPRYLSWDDDDERGQKNLDDCQEHN